MEKVVMGFLGCGNIGCGVWNLLKGFKEELAHRFNVEIYVKKVLVRNVGKARNAEVPADVLTDQVSDVTDDPEITLIAEFMGGEEPATQYMIRSMEHGKTVVTANKMAVALNWHLLQASAEKNNVGLYYEASVCGAIPIIRTVTDSLQANRIQRMMGIVNGTTNYILTRMSQKGEKYDDVLADAQKLGLAEPDPTSDVEGYDAAYKISILSSLAFHARIPYRYIHREGISRVSPIDIAFGKELGYTLKLLAIAKREGNTVDARVHPTFVPDSHPLASVSGSYNAVFLHGDSCDDMMVFGRGAGSAPTASAVVSDIIFAVTHKKPLHPTFKNTDELDSSLQVTDDWNCGFYIRLSAVEATGVLGHITACFGENGVSIRNIIQRDADEDGRVPIVIITHTAGEKAVRKALDSLDESLAQLITLIRVEE